jgi:cardiolipin synthase
VNRLAAEIPGGVRAPALAELLQRIDSGPIHAGNAVRAYFDGAEAFSNALAAIDSAEREVLVESYILRDDETGTRLAEALFQARRRGVTVRVLADGWGSLWTRTSYWRSLRAEGIESRLFHPLPTHWHLHAYRDHRKIIVVDRRVGFTGGMNIANEYGSSRSASGKQWRDTHARVEGPAAAELATVFEEGWCRAGGRPLPTWSTTAEPSGNTRVLIVDSSAGRGQSEKVSTLAAIVGGARQRLWITNAYFAPKPRAIRQLAAAAERGVDVRLLLPGISDVPIVRHASHAVYDELLAAGVRVFEYLPSVLHAKTFVVDDHLAIVGSSNLDFRSFRYNAECNLIILDDAFGRELAEAFERDLLDSIEVQNAEWLDRSLPHRMLDGLAHWMTPLL